MAKTKFIDNDTVNDVCDLIRLKTKQIKSRVIDSILTESEDNPAAYAIGMKLSGNDLMDTIGDLVLKKAKNQEQQQSNVNYI